MTKNIIRAKKLDIWILNRSFFEDVLALKNNWSKGCCLRKNSLTVSKLTDCVMQALNDRYCCSPKQLRCTKRCEILVFWRKNESVENLYPKNFRKVHQLKPTDVHKPRIKICAECNGSNVPHELLKWRSWSSKLGVLRIATFVPKHKVAKTQPKKPKQSAEYQMN